jgi:hypothetical protein
MMKLLITIDTESYPMTANWRGCRLADDLRRDVYGMTADGEFGIRYQSKVLRDAGLKAVFFVEALFASVPEIGSGPLEQIVGEILDAGHEVQLHLHPEWVQFIPILNLPPLNRINHYKYDQQKTLLELGMNNLAKAGVSVTAFRAGDYAANSETLRALSDLGLKYDTSYNLPYLGTNCTLKALDNSLRPTKINGVWEFPITHFQDYPGHCRHLQLSACSANEIRHVIDKAAEKEWGYLVLVSHSFEMLNNRRSREPVSVSLEVVRRFEQLAGLLRARTAQVQTVGFNDLGEPPYGSADIVPIKGLWRNTALRNAEQIYRRASLAAARLGTNLY